MVEHVALIRQYTASDEKLARFVIGKANMECLAVANHLAYVHPLMISIWLVLSCVFIEFMQWWPNKNHGIVGYLSPLPALAAVAVPLMSAVDWFNRPYFEKHTQDVLRGADVTDIIGYYSRSRSSGFWILDYGDQFVGLIALDASHDSGTEILSSVKGTKSLSYKGTAGTALIRHFFVDEAYRGSGIQMDLLNHAVRHAFNADHALQRIRGFDSPLAKYARICLRKAGFHFEQSSRIMGVLGWKLSIVALEKEDWAKTAD